MPVSFRCTIVPVIDLMHGQVVRAVRGERARVPADRVAPGRRQRPGRRGARRAARPLPADSDAVCTWPISTRIQGGRGAARRAAPRCCAALPDVTLWLDAGFTGPAAAHALRNAHAAPTAARVRPVYGSESLADAAALDARPPTREAILSLDCRQRAAARSRPAAGSARRAGPATVIVMTLDRVGAAERPGPRDLRSALRAHGAGPSLDRRRRRARRRRPAPPPRRPAPTAGWWPARCTTARLASRALVARASHGSRIRGRDRLDSSQHRARVHETCHAVRRRPRATGVPRRIDTAPRARRQRTAAPHSGHGARMGVAWHRIHAWRCAGGTGIWLATAAPHDRRRRRVPAWTCPFCSLLCDDFALGDAASPSLRGSDCPRARAALAAHRRSRRRRDAAHRRHAGDAGRRDRGRGAAAGRWRQPLFGGLGTDVAGARALYRLAVRTGAICDPADGAALMHGLRALQDRGQYHDARWPRCASRADLHRLRRHPGASSATPSSSAAAASAPPAARARGLVFLGVPRARAGCLPACRRAGAAAAAATCSPTVQQLAALRGAAARAAAADPALAALAGRLREARYAVLVWEAGALPAHGALLVEALNRIVGDAQPARRARPRFALGGGDGAPTVNQVFTWLSGLPLRTARGPLGLEHEPLRFGADAPARRRRGRRAAVDLELRRDRARRRPAICRRIVLGPAGDGVARCGAARRASSSRWPRPGIDAAGHLFRTDGTVVVPLSAVRDDGLPGVDVVLRSRLADALESRT